ncbi:Uncharacterised protein [Serratia marcescens]|nr:Uncharacterised protein [Serratia marcescens]CVE48030.1 Uncharacterised protein [Serratia marcescens]
MDLPRQLTERLPRFARRAAAEQALVHRVARRQRIRRRRHRPLVRRLRHAGEAGAVAPDAQRHPGRLVAQPGAEEQVVRRHRVKLPAHPLLRAQNVVLLAQQAAHLALRQQVGAVLQRDRHLAAADRRRSAALDPIALAVRPHFHRVARTRLEADVAGHVQSADRVARRHGAALTGGQRTDRTAAADDAAALHADGRSDRAVDCQPPLIDQRRAGIGVVTRQHQRADALLGQAAVAGDVVTPEVQAAQHIAADALGRFALVQHRADARQIHHELGRAVGHARRIRDAEFFGNILDGRQHARAVDGFAQVDHPPAVERVDARRPHVGGGGFQHFRHLRAIQIRETLHQHRDAAGHVRRRHRGAAVFGVAGRQILHAGAFNHRAVYPGARRRNAEAGGVAAAGREGADAVVAAIRGILQAGDRQPVRCNLRHEIGQAGHGIGVIQIAVVTGGEDGDHAAARRVDRALIGAAGLGAEDLFDLIELLLRIVYREVWISRVITPLLKLFGNADAPAVVDDARAAGHQRIPAGLVHRAVVAEDDAVLRAGIAVFGADDLRVERHAVHGAAVAAAGGDAAHVGTVRTERAIGVHARRTVIAESVAFFHRDIGIGVFADAFGDQIDHLILTGKFGMLGVDRLIENAKFDAFSGITSGVGLVGVDRPQPPFRVELTAAPAGRIARFAVLYIAGSLRPADRRQADQHRAPLCAMNSDFRPAEGRPSGFDSSKFLLHPRYRPLLFANVL